MELQQEYREKAFCCICNAYAESVDMVSSQRFERFFHECFKLSKPRSGYLCSSCLSCVRKWRKSPKERRKSMSYIVDCEKSVKKARQEEPAKKPISVQATDTTVKNNELKGTTLEKTGDDTGNKQQVERKRHRSLVGCCICGAKSSATEFSHASKFSRFLKDCFQLEQKREGELCHSCREIIRKWRREPRGGKSNYNHIVDSKVVPKKKYSSSSSRSKSSEQKETNPKENKKEFKSVGQIFTYDNAVDDTLSEDDDDIDDDDARGVKMDTPSPSPPSSIASDYSDPFDPPRKKLVSTASQTAFLFPMLTSPQGVNSRLPFIDLSTWRQESICCGSIFRGPNGEVLVDPKWLKPFCDFCNRSAQPPTPIEKNNPTEISVFDEKLASLCATTS